MEINQRISCVTALDSEMHSPIGIAVTSAIDSINYPVKEFEDFVGIKKELFKNSFSTVKEFLDRLDFLSNRLRLSIGETTDISIGISQMQQNIHEALEKYTTVCSKIDKSSINYARKISNFLPNSSEEYNEAVSKMSEVRPRRRSLSFESASPPNIDRLIDDIHRLKCDKDVQEVSRLFKEFEPQSIETNSYLSVRLPQCSPYALRIVQNFVSHCEKKQPPISSQIPKSGSGSALNIAINSHLAANPNNLRIFQNYLLARRQQTGQKQFTFPPRALSESHVEDLRKNTLPTANKLPFEKGNEVKHENPTKEQKIISK